MNTFLRFFYEFISIFFDGVVKIFNGFIEGFKQMFKFSEYTKVISNYNASLTGIEKVFMYISVFVIVAILFLIIFLIIMHLRKLFRRVGNTFNKEELLEEITNLNEQVAKLMKEKDEIMAMKVSQLGVNPDGDSNIDPETGEPTEDEEEIDTETTIRFPKLAMIDAELGKTKVKNYGVNNLLVELYLVIGVNSFIMSPSTYKEFGNTYEIIVSSKVVVGRIPVYYGDVIEQSSAIVSS